MIATQLAIAILLLGVVAGEPEILGPRAVKLSYRPAQRSGLEKREFAVTTPEQTVLVFLSSVDNGLNLYGRPDSKQDRGFVGNESSTFREVSNDFSTIPKSMGYIAATDKITFGNDTLENAEFVYLYGNWANDASWGFGFPTGNKTQPSFWHNVSATWADKRIGLFLSRHREDPKTVDSGGKELGYKDSELMIAGVNEDKFTGEISSYAFTPDLDGGWPIPLEGVTVNGKAVNISSVGAKPFNGSGQTTQIKAYPSTSSARIYAPREVVERIYANIPGAKLVRPENNPHNDTWEFPCESTTSIDVRFTIGGREYAIQPRDMVTGFVTDNMRGGVYNNGPTPANGSCVGAFAALGQEPSWRWFIGTPFLKNVYTVFDFATPAVGFAQLSPNAQPDVKGTAFGSSRHGMGISAVVVAAAAAAACLL